MILSLMEWMVCKIDNERTTSLLMKRRKSTGSTQIPKSKGRVSHNYSRNCDLTYRRRDTSSLQHSQLVNGACGTSISKVCCVALAQY